LIVLAVMAPPRVGNAPWSRVKLVSMRGDRAVARDADAGGVRLVAIARGRQEVLAPRLRPTSPDGRAGAPGGISTSSG
jgi:hypothetical protein